MSTDREATPPGGGVTGVPRHPSRARLVAVTTAGDQIRGSGYLLTSRLVVTAGHVVTPLAPGDLRVCRLQTLRGTPAEVLRIENDVAILLTAEDLAAPGEVPGVEMRELSPDARFEDCAALGLPAVMTRVTAGVAPLEAAFRVAPNSAGTHGYLSLELDGHPPDGPAPWRGMSGAPVFHAGRWLVGVVLRDSVGWAHSRLEAAPIGAFFDAARLADAVFRVQPPILASDARDAAYLEAYRGELARRYGHIELFGLGLHGHLVDDIGIDHAYVSLNAGLPALGLSSATEQSRPVEQLIPKNPRLLLRGDPGAGKSTLLEWLAVSMARGSCKGPLEPFNDKVPFLIRLRDMYAPRWKQVEGLDGVPPQPERFLDFSRMSTGSPPPDGWIRRMLEQDRAVLLVDGLDEVLESHRDGVLRWIRTLLRDFPALHIIVTGRPEALLRWSPPQELGFAELKLLELDEDQRAQLIHKWHQAAILGVRASRLGQEESERRIARLSALETALTTHINGSADLAALAATPLLCAVLCKLHEVHGTRLPRFRQELYARTVDMMLGLRDADRDVPDLLPRLDVDQRRAILSWVAGYLTAEGEREIALDRFDEKVRDRLRSLGRDAGTHTAEEIRKALHERSGLLIAPGEETLRFSHRTFQDYLAATDMVAQRSFGQLAAHAGDETWDDVLRFAMSQCNLADTREFVAQVRRKVRLVTNRNQRARMRMTAASCIPYAVQMAEEDRDWLIAGVAKSFRALAKAGEYGLVDYGAYVAAGPDLLSALERDFDWQDLNLCRHAIYLATELGGPEALHFLTRIPRAQRQQLSKPLANAWGHFPGAEYADGVLAGLDLEFLPIDSPQELASASVVGSVEILLVYKAASADEVAAFAAEHGVRELSLRYTALVDGISLAPLSTVPTLSVLDLGAVGQGVQRWFDSPEGQVRFGYWVTDEKRYELPALSGLTELALVTVPSHWTSQTAGWSHLTHLGLFGRAAQGIGSIESLPALTHLVVVPDAVNVMPPVPAHRGVTHLALVLSLGEGSEGVGLAYLPSSCPALTELLLLSPGGTGRPIDLTGLERMPGLRIRLSGFARGDHQLRGLDAFAKDRLVWE